jgi:hypothetical protein
MLYDDQQLPPQEQRVKWFDQHFPPSMLAAEERDLAKKAAEILSLLGLSSRKHSTAYDLDQAIKHIKAGSLVEARGCLERVTQASTSTLPEDLAQAKLLLFYTCTRLGIHRLKDCEYLRAAECFDHAQTKRPSTMSEDRVKGIRLFCACSLYEAGKRALKSGDWGIADEHFNNSISKEVLPPGLKSKAVKYLKQCRQKRSLVKRQTAQTTAWGWYGRSPTEKLLLGDGIDDKAHIYKQAKRGTKNKDIHLLNSDAIFLSFCLRTHFTTALANGNVNRAKVLFRKALDEMCLSNHLNDRAELYIDCLDNLSRQLAEGVASACVFDHVTEKLNCSMQTLGITTSMLALPTSSLSTECLHSNNRELVMVLDDKFPPDSKERGELILLLKLDVRRALNCLAEMQVLSIENGSVIVRFRFVWEGNDPVEVAWWEAEYLRQVDDNKSVLWQGKVTYRLDQKRTQSMTLQLGSRADVETPCMYQVGDTITLAQVQEEKIECKLESLLGKGTTATVFKVTTNGKVCALKVFKRQSSFVNLSEEASQLLMANHPQGHPNILVSSLQIVSIDLCNVDSVFCHVLHLDPIYL